MTLSLNQVMLGTTQPETLAEFYEKVFEREPDWQDGNWFGWKFGDFNLSIGEHSEAGGKAKDPVRIILNLETSEVESEFERIRDAGAEVIKEPYEMGGGRIATLADPDGNYFQLITPWEGME